MESLISTTLMGIRKQFNVRNLAIHGLEIFGSDGEIRRVMQSDYRWRLILKIPFDFLSGLKTHQIRSPTNSTELTTELS